MVDSQIAFWAMIGTWVAGIATFLAVLTSLYLSTAASKSKLLIRIRYYGFNNNIELTLLNRGHVYVEVEKINLVIKNQFSVKDQYDNSYGRDLIRWFLESDEFDLDNLKLFPNSDSRKIEIEFCSLQMQYNKFLPYNNVGEILRPVKMPKCYIGVFLTSGEVFYIKLPSDFYHLYRESIGNQYDRELSLLSNNPSNYYAYDSPEELHIKQQSILNEYFKARRNYNLLFC
ncbi:hypothetical protein [Aliivibrio fischeri]|uniref:hypothetical protein n=1 Tax=Aliivibrio fischeri TaxID=668 RepID=UPI0012DA5309|nr:hypothetical protein [Aliivibrio fischeri]MUL11813.1 hypothetical protein [Aliivibrio fischeri]MUL15439.1 hypothetical protein [Aliivibrio fischeri]